MSNELVTQERAVRIARVKMRGEFKNEFAKEFPELLDDSKVAAAQHLNYTQVIEQSVRDALSATQMKLMDKLQAQNTSLIELGFDYGARKQALSSYVTGLERLT